MINGRLRIHFNVVEAVNTRMNESLPVLENQLIALGLQLDNLSSNPLDPISSEVVETPEGSRLDISI